jgi:hypothetical protein
MVNIFSKLAIDTSTQRLAIAWGLCVCLLHVYVCTADGADGPFYEFWLLH